MTLDITALVAPLSEEAPSGPDLSYDNLRVDIDGKFERPVSDDGGESDVDWGKVNAQILELAAKTRDIGLPVYLIRSAALSRRFDLLVDAAQWLAQLLEERWADVHPQLDEYGFIGRKAPCESLTRIADFLGPLGKVPLIEHARFGRFTCSDMERFAEQGVSAEGYGAFRAAVGAMDAEQIASIVERFDTLRQSFRRVDAVLTDNAEGDTATNFKSTHEKLDSYRKALSVVFPGETEADDQGSAAPENVEEGASGDFTHGATTPAAAALSGAIRNRDDVARALDAICVYYKAMEPGSPVPLLLQRAREWIGLDFMTVLEDLVPSGVDEAARVLRSKRALAAAQDPGPEVAAWSGPSSQAEW